VVTSISGISGSARPVSGMWATLSHCPRARKRHKGGE
jgi:hypothetical protein